jgi:hypothetical protein
MQNIPDCGNRMNRKYPSFGVAAVAILHHLDGNIGGHGATSERSRSRPQHSPSKYNTLRVQPRNHLDPLAAQEDKKTGDLKPADPDTGESTVEESTLGLLPNPLEKKGLKLAVTYIGEALGNPSGGQKRGAVYEDRINFAVDVDFEKLWGAKQLANSD